MNPQVKEKWINALRSGEYPQSKNYLQSGQGFCCLGVLCDIYAKETNKSWFYIDSDTGEDTPIDELENAVDQYDYFYIDNEPVILPESVANWAELESPSPEVVVSDGHEDWPHAVKKKLVVLNDMETSFEELADLIEKSL